MTAKYTIRKRFNFSASHQLFGLADDHPCLRLHGHNYIVEVELTAAQLNSVGFVRDYRDLSKLKQYIDGHLDHQHLNEVLGDDYTTAEHIARILFEKCRSYWPEVSAVSVSETPNTWAEYRLETSN